VLGIERPRRLYLFMEYKFHFQEKRDKQRIERQGFFPQSSLPGEGIWVRSEVKLEINNINNKEEIKESLKSCFLSLVTNSEFNLLKKESYIDVSLENNNFAEIKILNGEINVQLI